MVSLVTLTSLAASVAGQCFLVLPELERIEVADLLGGEAADDGSG